MKSFIAFDWCGWNNRYGRFTLVAEENSTTLVQQGHMGQKEWDHAQLEWFRKYPGLTVYRCPENYVPDPTNVMGTVEEIIQRLKERLSQS